MKISNWQAVLTNSPTEKGSLRISVFLVKFYNIGKKNQFLSKAFF